MRVIVLDKPFEILGLDVGNGYIKAASASGEPVIESVYAQFDGGEHIFHDQAEPVNVYVPKKYGNERYVLGQHDVDKYGTGGALNTIDMKGRLERRTYHILVQMAMIHAMPQSKDAKLMVITGVPEGEKIAEAQKSYHAMINGVNVIEKNGESFVRTVEDIKVLHQPSGLLFDLHLDQDGYVRDEAIVRGKTLVVDIGEGTTDVSVFHDLRKVLGFRITIGISDVSRRILEQIGNDIKAPITLADMQRTVRSHDKTLVAGREQVDITSLVTLASQSVIDRIFAQIQSRIPDRHEFSHIVFGGGGAGFFSTPLHDWEKDAVIVHDQTAIARGFRKYGLAVARRKGLIES